jgi:hypothetical protein
MQRRSQGKAAGMGAMRVLEAPHCTSCVVDLLTERLTALPGALLAP